MRYFAFLRAINVGGHHLVTMDQLRELFESLRFTGVETYIASGNVVFDSPWDDLFELEQAIEEKLFKALGYEVRTFVRRGDELAAIVALPAFPPERSADDASLYVGLLAEPPTEAGVEALAALRCETDDLLINGQELYWLRRSPDSRLDNAAFEKALKAKATFRNINTLRQLVAKYPPA